MKAYMEICSGIRFRELFLLVLLFSACGTGNLPPAAEPSIQPTNVALIVLPTDGMDVPLPPAATPASSGVTVRVLQKFGGSEIATDTANGIEMSAANFRLEGDYLLIDVCHQNPNDRDWTLGESVIEINGANFPIFEAKVLEISQALENGQSRIHSFYTKESSESQKQEWEVVDTGSNNYRCDTIYFLVGDIQPPFKAVLNVMYIISYPSEGEGCEAYQEVVKNILEQKDLGIEVECRQVNGRSSFVVLEKPASMSQEEADKQVFFAKREAYSIQGPWNFTETVYGQ